MNAKFALDDVQVNELYAKRKSVDQGDTEESDLTSANDSSASPVEVTAEQEAQLQTLIPGPHTDLPADLAMAALKIRLDFPFGELFAEVEGKYTFAGESGELVTEKEFLEFLNAEGLVELTAYVRASFTDLAARVFRGVVVLPSFKELGLSFSTDDKVDHVNDGTR